MLIISGEQTGRREGKNEIDGTAPNIYPSQTTKCYVQFVNDLMWFIYRDSLTSFQIKSRLIFNHWNVLRLRRFLVSSFSSSQLSYDFFFIKLLSPQDKYFWKIVNITFLIKLEWKTGQIIPALLKVLNQHLFIFLFSQNSKHLNVELEDTDGRIH